MRPDPSRPVVPGHEVVGAIDAIGDGVTEWKVGDRVGVGFLGGHCGVCAWCRRGDFVNCETQPQTGTTVDGGYTEVMYARESGLVRIPDAMSAVDAAPLLCAGITTYKTLVGLNAGPDALVAIQNIGGLGHLGLQYADKLGLPRGRNRAWHRQGRAGGKAGR
jgi:propanol-preferring alcohol dehydrogenase